MERVKPSPHEVYEVLEEKKRLLEIRAQIDNMLDKVKSVLNSLAVENYQLTQTELNEELREEDEQQQQQEQEITIESIKQEALMMNTVRESEINQQLLDIDIKPCFDDMEIDSDEELDQL